MRTCLATPAIRAAPTAPATSTGQENCRVPEDAPYPTFTSPLTRRRAVRTEVNDTVSARNRTIAAARTFASQLSTASRRVICSGLSARSIAAASKQRYAPGLTLLPVQSTGHSPQPPAM